VRTFHKPLHGLAQGTHKVYEAKLHSYLELLFRVGFAHGVGLDLSLSHYCEE
jgi:hypothetical protein